MNHRYQVGNMKCGGCVATVRNALEQLPGCKKAEVDLESGVASVESEAEPDSVLKLLEGLGYPARLL